MLDLHSTVCDTPLYWCDYRVARVAVYDAADRLIADVRVSTGGTPDRADTDCGRAILKALAGGPLAAGDLSAACGYSGGWFRAVLAALVVAGRVAKAGKKYGLPPAGE